MEPPLPPAVVVEVSVTPGWLSVLLYEKGLDEKKAKLRPGVQGSPRLWGQCPQVKGTQISS